MYRLPGQGAVEPPPQELEDLPEVNWCRGRHKATREGGVKMVVEVDETRKNHPTARIETPGVGELLIEFGQRTHGHDAIIRPGDGAVDQDGERISTGHHDAVV